MSNLLALLSISSVAVHLEYPDIQAGRRLADEETPSQSQTPYLVPRALIIIGCLGDVENTGGLIAHL